MSNYSEVLKKAFPVSSEIRSNESSNGAILFDALGKDLENITTESIRKAEMYYSEGSWLNAPGEVYLYKKETSDFLESLEGYKRSNTFEHFFTDLSEAVKYNFSKLNSFEEVSITSTLETRTFVEDYLKIDVYELSSINKKNIEDREEDIVLGIFLRGVDYFNNKVEEIISIEEEGLYISKTKFLYLEPLEYIKSLNISGGPAVEAVGADNFSYKISNKYYRDWVESGEVKTKTLRSKKTSFKMQEAQNEAKLEEAYAKYVIEKNNSSTRIKCIHRIFGLNRYYKNIRYENIQDEVEEITYEIELVDNLGASILLVDCCYSEKYEKLFAITSNGKLLAYDMSPGSFILGAHERSREADLKIDVDLRRPHQSETVNLRVFTSSPTFYTDYFIVVRHDRTSNTYSTLIDKAHDEENGKYLWASDASINYLHGLANIEENQDSVLITSFEDTVEQGQIDYYALNVRNKKIFNDAIGDLTFFSDSKFSDMEKLRNAAVKSGGSCYRTSILSSKTKPVYEILLSSEGIENTAKLNIKRIDHSIEISESSDGESIFKETRDYYIQENKNIYFLKNNPNVVINDSDINANNVSKILLGTKVDNLGLMYGLSREKEESLEDFWKRIEMSKTLDYRIDIDSLSYSLLYKRQSKAKAEFCILSTNNKEIEFLSSGISIDNIIYSYKEYKFNKDLLGLFDFNGILYKKLKDYNEWTRCKFLSRLSLEKLEVKEILEEKRNALSQTAIEVYSNVEGLTSTNSGEDTAVSTYSFDNNKNIIWLNNDAPVGFNYKYKNLPLVVWSCDSNWFSLEDKDIDYRIKEKDDTLSDERMILTQEGVKVINKVLTHYNYYWGQ